MGELPATDSRQRNFCSGAHQIEKITPTMTYYRNSQGELRTKGRTSIMFIGSQQDCKEAFRRGLELTKKLDALHGEYTKEEENLLRSLIKELTTQP